MTKLKQLATIEGYDDVFDMLNDAVTDSVVPGICSNPHCNYTVGVEPDQDRGWCESCQSNTVKSCLILAGVI